MEPNFYAAGLSSIVLLVVFHVNVSQADIITGPCENASRGQTHHKCELQCNSGGGCTETVSTEACTCDGTGIFTVKYTNFIASISQRFILVFQSFATLMRLNSAWKNYQSLNPIL